MPRTTPDLVAGIIEVDGSIPLDPFILAATILVDDIAVESHHSPDRLQLIETWLSAHFYAVRDPRPVMERASTIEARYQSKVDLNLAVTHYGQMAMVLDTSRLLRAISVGKRKTRAIWLGKEPANVLNI